jgi:secreted PhoX family phosphatase
MTLKRRDLLLFLSTSAATVACDPLFQIGQKFSKSFKPNQTTTQPNFQPVSGPMPLETDSKTAVEQISHYTRYTVVDDLVLPQGFIYDVIAAWGDPIGNSHFGYNNDYLSFVTTATNEGYLTVNFEYISAVPWIQSYQKVIGKSLPFDEVKLAVKAAGKGGINAYSLTDSDPLKVKIREISQAALSDQGIGVISIRKTANGSWERTNSQADRRIAGNSGVDDGHYLKSTGPAKAIFLKTSGEGYVDGLGDRIIGTFGNCAGGTTPWGTVLSAEENFQLQVPEPVYADGTSFDPQEQTFSIGEEELFGQGNVLGLAGNKYGWIVEIDPADPDDYGTKHTWLGRYRHEAVGIRVIAGKPLAFYSGCDRRGGHLYKFVSRDSVRNPTDKANSRLLDNGVLYAAKFNSNGTGHWIPLQEDTPVEPDSTSNIEGNTLLLPQRPQGGNFKANDEDIRRFKQQFKTLGDLYRGNTEEKQGAVLIDAHYAANAAGATCTARPEDTEIAPDGSLYVTFTSGSSDKNTGGPDKRIFQGPGGDTAYEYGFIMHLTENGNEPAATNFSWKMLALGGEPVTGGAGFANPDNLLIDTSGHIWMVTDMSSDKHNKEIPSRLDKKGDLVNQSNLRGLFGNNSIWFIPTSGTNAGNAYLFGMGPMECETTGPLFTPDQETFFLSVQHPGEVHGIRQEQASKTRKFAMKTTDGKDFVQTREVPIGSNWPTKGVNEPPKPAVVAIRRSEKLSII